MEKFTFAKLPMPPSSNHQYWHQVMKGKGGQQVARPTPTGDLKKFNKAVEVEWKELNLVAVYKCRKLLREWMLRGQFIRVEVYAFFNYFDLFTQQGVPKRMDASNRIKALHDSLATVLEIDDSWFWDCEIRKRETKNAESWCAVTFYPVEHMSLKGMQEKGIL